MQHTCVPILYKLWAFYEFKSWHFEIYRVHKHRSVNFWVMTGIKGTLELYSTSSILHKNTIFKKKRMKSCVNQLALKVTILLLTQNQGDLIWVIDPHCLWPCVCEANQSVSVTTILPSRQISFKSVPELPVELLPLSYLKSFWGKSRHCEQAENSVSSIGLNLRLMQKPNHSACSGADIQNPIKEAYI